MTESFRTASMKLASSAEKKEALTTNLPLNTVKL